MPMPERILIADGLVFRPDTHQPSNGCAVLLVTSVLVGVLDPKRLDGLSSEDAVPVVRWRSTNLFQNALQRTRVIGNDRRGLLATAIRFFSDHCRSSCSQPSL